MKLIPWYNSNLQFQFVSKLNHAFELDNMNEFVVVNKVENANLKLLMKLIIVIK